VQKSGDHIRVTAQLIDAVNDNHLLSQKYDRNLTDLFALEDDLTLQIAGALDVQFSGTMWARIAARGTRNLEAWENAVKAHYGYLRLNPADMNEAQGLANRAVDLDPNYTWAYNRLAYTHFQQAVNGWVDGRVAALGRARQLNDKVMQLDPEFAGAYSLRARLEMLPDLPEFDPEAALVDAQKSVQLGPNEDDAHWTLGFVLYSLRRFDEAVAEFAITVRLDPHSSNLRNRGLHAIALSASGQHEQAIAEVKTAVATAPKNPYGPWFRGHVEMWAGHYVEAAGSFERARELDPASALLALSLAAIYDQLGRVGDAISLLEKGPLQWRSIPEVPLWLALSYALVGHKEQASAEFAALRGIAPKYTVTIAQRAYTGYFESKFLDRIVALSRE